MLAQLIRILPNDKPEKLGGLAEDVQHVFKMQRFRVPRVCAYALVRDNLSLP